jgi:hypothetical protein
MLLAVGVVLLPLLEFVLSITVVSRGCGSETTGRERLRAAMRTARSPAESGRLLRRRTRSSVLMTKPSAAADGKTRPCAASHKADDAASAFRVAPIWRARGDVGVDMEASIHECALIFECE